MAHPDANADRLIAELFDDSSPEACSSPEAAACRGEEQLAAAAPQACDPVPGLWLCKKWLRDEEQVQAMVKSTRASARARASMRADAYTRARAHAQAALLACIEAEGLLSAGNQAMLFGQVPCWLDGVLQRFPAHVSPVSARRKCCSPRVRCCVCSQAACPPLRAPPSAAVCPPAALRQPCAE